MGARNPRDPRRSPPYREGMKRRVVAPAVVLAAVFALSGCVILPPGPQPEIPGETLVPGDPVGCDDELLVNQPGEHRVGDCEVLTIEGQGIEVIAGDVGALVIRGDDIEVDAGSIGSVEINGQENNVEAAAIGGVEIAGDRNEVESAGDVGSVTIGGNDNEVTFQESAGSIDDRGDRNEIHQDR